MTKTDTFNKAFDFVMKFEGGYVNDPKDPGGETKYGISKKAYPDIDIQSLTISRAANIYLHDYWNKCSCNKLPPNLAIAVFDCAVNQGVSIAIKLLQQAADVTADGIIGINTLNSIKADTLVNFMVLRALRYTKSRVFGKYGYGWFRRLMSLMELFML